MPRRELVAGALNLTEPHGVSMAACLDGSQAVVRTPPKSHTTMSIRFSHAFAIFLGLILLTGCGDAPSSTPAGPGVTSTPISSRTPTPSVTVTSTPSLTPSPTATPTPTATFTPTATPTPTALPVRVRGNPRTVGLASPEPQPGAPCGVVDTLDFPLRPPDGVGVGRGGSDFGVYRERYEGVHTGEDWWIGRGRDSSFGEPVYSIAHGQVTYAQPNGWGADRGVVIVRHTFPDGTSFLSQYGHLDPPSVVLGVGACVARGDKLGVIGRPRTSPHLHWEIRSQMPAEPGPGYWYTDPTTAGWLPPSQTIWDYRLAHAPGVLWSSSSSQVRQGLGLTADGDYLFEADYELYAMDTVEGTARWTRPISSSTDLLLSEDGATAYLGRIAGTVQALGLSGVDSGGEGNNVGLRWEADLDVIGLPKMLPLPAGGVAVSVGPQLYGLSPEGELLWTYPDFPRPLYWARSGERLIVGTADRENGVWYLDQSGPVPGLATITGIPLDAGEQLFLYAADGLYRLEPNSLAAELLYPLPYGLIHRGDLKALPNGALLLAHNDLHHSRLILLEPDGQVRWERSYEDIIFGWQRLLLLDGRPYLFSSYNRSLAEGVATSQVEDEVALFAIDLETADLTRILVGGTRNPSPTDTAVVPLEQGQVLINIGGMTVLRLDAAAALEAVLGQ